MRSSRANTPQEGVPDMRSPDHQQQMESMSKPQTNRAPSGPSPLPGGPYGAGGMPQDPRMRPQPGVMPPGAFPPRPNYQPDYGAQDPYASYPSQRYPPSRYPTPGAVYSMMPPPPPPSSSSSGYPPEYQKMWPYMMPPEHQNYPRPPYHQPPDMYTRSGTSYPPMSNGVSPPRGPPMRYSHPPQQLPPSGMEGIVPPQTSASQQDQHQMNYPPNRSDSRGQFCEFHFLCSGCILNYSLFFSYR